MFDLKLIKWFFFINHDLTLTFDPVTLTLLQIEALINANVMIESGQDLCPPLAITDNPKSHISV